MGWGSRRPSATPRSGSSAVARRNSTKFIFYVSQPERLPGSRVNLLGLGQWHRECVVDSKQIKFQSQSVMADVCLGVTVAGLYALVGMGLTIVFM
jgi:hypothetical protein